MAEELLREGGIIGPELSAIADLRKTASIVDALPAIREQARDWARQWAEEGEGDRQSAPLALKLSAAVLVVGFTYVVVTLAADVLFALADGICMRMLTETDHDFSGTIEAGVIAVRGLLD